MKRLSKVIAIVATAFFVPVAASMPAAAAMTCQIGYTGPDSNNMCTSEVAYSCTVTNGNEVTIVNTSTQEATSGTVTDSGNQNGDNATSGTVTNNNGTTFDVTITNGSDICVAKAVVPATETPETPTTPVKPTQEVTPKALPVTSGSQAPALLTLAGSIVGVAAITFVYRKLHL